MKSIRTVTVSVSVIFQVVLTKKESKFAILDVLQVINKSFQRGQKKTKLK